jgi:hypothetical protein
VYTVGPYDTHPHRSEEILQCSDLAFFPGF